MTKHWARFASLHSATYVQLMPCSSAMCSSHGSMHADSLRLTPRCCVSVHLSVGLCSYSWIIHLMKRVCCFRQNKSLLGVPCWEVVNLLFSKVSYSLKGFVSAENLLGGQRWSVSLFFIFSGRWQIVEFVHKVGRGWEVVNFTSVICSYYTFFISIDNT